MAGDETPDEWWPALPFLTNHPEFGWTEEIRNLVTAVLDGDDRWAQIVLSDMDRADLVASTLVSVGLIVRSLALLWDATTQEIAEEWGTITVQLSEAADHWDGSPVTHPFDVLEDGPDAEDQ